MIFCRGLASGFPVPGKESIDSVDGMSFDLAVKDLRETVAGAGIVQICGFGQ